MNNNRASKNEVVFLVTPTSVRVLYKDPVSLEEDTYPLKGSLTSLFLGPIWSDFSSKYDLPPTLNTLKSSIQLSGYSATPDELADLKEIGVESISDSQIGSWIWDRLSEIGQQTHRSEILCIDFSLKGIRIWGKFKEKELEIYNRKFESVYDFVTDVAVEGVKPFMAEPIDIYDFPDFFAQLYVNPPVVRDVSLNQDLLRAYVTSKLIKLSNIGISGSKLLIIFTGDLFSYIDSGHRNLAIIDGLQLSDETEVWFDTKYVIASGITLSLDWLSKHEGLAFERSRYLNFTIDPLKKSGPAVLGRKLLPSGGTEQFFVMVNEIAKVTGVLGSVITLEISEGVSLTGLTKRKVELECDGNLILDTRKQPVVYGPDYSKNQEKVINWVNQLI
ncbi:hypothetical protein JW962_02175 [Candidatus Dojkabacteria bacterium]|nr:hypothetical protein [Candidatus Dojkabacteria bacterium]